MKIEITYPERKKKDPSRREVIRYVRVPFILLALASLIVNLAVGGKAWSVIVLWALSILWRDIFAPDIVEYNLISQFIKVGVQVCVLLVLIDVLLAPGWAMTVVPIVCFSLMIVSFILFLSDLEKQRHNMMPMLMLCLISLILSLVIMLATRPIRWPIIVMASVSLAILLSSVFTLGRDFLRSLRKYFHAH